MYPNICTDPGTATKQTPLSLTLESMAIFGCTHLCKQIVMTYKHIFMCCPSPLPFIVLTVTVSSSQSFRKHVGIAENVCLSNLACKTDSDGFYTCKDGRCHISFIFYLTS